MPREDRRAEIGDKTRMHIGDEHVQHWHRHGYDVVERFLSPRELLGLRRELGTILPTWAQYFADKYSPFSQFYGRAPGHGYMVEAPALGTALNLIAAHPDLIDFVERALGTRDVLLHQTQVWAKYGGDEDFAQELHADYVPYSILVPAPADTPEQVTGILYYVDVTLDLGPTYVVPREQSTSEPLVPHIRSRQGSPALYRHERPVLVPAGSLLLFDLRTLHRASAISNPYGVRLSHHFAYRRADANWVGYVYWAVHSYAKEWQQLIEAATPRQREVFGVPRIGHAYWNEETLAGMAARYPAMDIAPYAAGAGVSLELVSAERDRLTRPETSATGTPFDSVRVAVRAMRTYAPVAAAYYEGILDYYHDRHARGSGIKPE
jgi:hypothetical protein